MAVLAQDSMFEVAGERNAYSNIRVAALNEKWVSCPVDYTREVSNKVVLHPGELVSFSSEIWMRD